MNVTFLRVFSLLCCIGFISEISSAQDLRAEELRRLGRTAFYEGHYGAAEENLRQSLAMFEAQADSSRTDIAITRGDLAWSLVTNGNYAEAEGHLNSALAMLRGDRDEHCDQMAILLSHLGTLYQKTHRFKKAESTLKQALDHAQRCAPTYIEVVLNDIGVLYGETGKLKQATAALERALAISERHPEISGLVVAQSLTSLAAIYLTERKSSQAEQLLVRARQLLESSLDGRPPDLSITFLSFTLEQLGLLYYRQGRLDEAEHQLIRATEIEGLHHMPDSARRARLSFVLAQILTAKGKYESAKALYQQALPDDVLDTAETAVTLEQYSKLLRVMNADAQAAEMDLRAKKIRVRLSYTVSVK